MATLSEFGENIGQKSTKMFENPEDFFSSEWFLDDLLPKLEKKFGKNWDFETFEESFYLGFSIRKMLEEAVKGK